MILTDLPTYLYYSEETPHRGDGALFHFTKYDSLKKILDDLTLQPSSFGNLNDLNEGNVSNMCLSHNFTVMYDTEKYINECCHILCFSQNYEISGYSHEGSNHPAMWAHYADNSNGVCIVIDKEQFIEKNKSIVDACFCKFEDVEYKVINTPNEEDILYNADKPEEFIRNNWHSLFFLKHKDWENEDEHRFFIMDYDGKLSIEGCIKYIVLGRKLFLNDARIKEIMDKVVTPGSVCYRKFIPHSFATTCYGTKGYQTFEIAGKIMAVVKKNCADNRYANYANWLKNELGYC